MPEQLGYLADRHPGALQLDGVRVPQAVRVHALFHPGLAAEAVQGVPDVLVGHRAARQRAEQRAAADAERLAGIDPAGQASSQLGWKPRVVALSPLPCSTRTLCLRRSTSAGLRATISLTLRPERYSSAIRARFRIPLADLAEHAPISACTSSAVRTSAGYFRPLFGGSWPGCMSGLIAAGPPGIVPCGF